jgi:hypothetical protein
MLMVSTQSWAGSVEPLDVEVLEDEVLVAPLEVAPEEVPLLVAPLDVLPDVPPELLVARVLPPVPP